MKAAPRAVHIAVEGSSDEAVARRLLQDIPLSVSRVHGRKGKQHLLGRLVGFNAAAEIYPWVVLVDLDHSSSCAPSSASEWLPNPAKYMFFSIAVRAVEAWLLADRQEISSWLSVPAGKIAAQPDTLPNPKQSLIQLAAKSRRRRIQEGMAAPKGSEAKNGPLYGVLLSEFIQQYWTPHRAAKHSPSLARCLRRMEEWAAKIPAP